ncbi:peptidoglycan-binding domain-containing protein [Streptomyces sp. NBC_01198]|uniref:peptidoglycan-binding domain-containing protein n=1 Tax=Streptomyces sp. NBC_01198 TaxID=2903769 RepID=UPI002E1535C2|nr:peptidoglycan-binding protein [Streptomyces sp. NBC_01198]
MTGVTSEYAEVTGADDEGGGEVRAAERSAERAAALAVTEGFHPLRVRPYVGDPDDTFGGGTTVRPLLDVRRGGDGPDTQDLGLFPAAYAAMAAAKEYPADDGAREVAAAVAAAHGRHRRRRRGIVVAAAAVAASALAAGAVAVTGSVMGEEQGGTDRALPEPASAAPDVTLPADAAPGAVTEPVKVTPHHPMRATTTPAPKVATSSPPTSAAPSTTASASAPAATATTTAPPPSSSSPSPPPSGTPSTPDVLQLGASGPEVTDLQQRLTAVWVYHGPMDGHYDSGVEHSVAMFQVWYGVHGDPSGVYGPATRAALLHATPSDHTHHH